MINPAARRPPPRLDVSAIDLPPRYLAWFVGFVCLVVLFVNLGGADLFQPDEGRNAEKAREILLLNDWVTPHENFLPVLDKPMFFYWLVAFCYKLFGISEWSARLPSTASAIGCLFLVYRFTRQWRGPWEALWAVVILLTSVEFFVLARIVISDMTLTFFLTLALYSFYSAVHAENEKSRRLYCLLLYGALGAGTLTKGLIGVVMPGMVFFVYLLSTHKLSCLRKLHLFSGALLFLVIVVPWYLWVDMRNPGYLRFYFWDDHLARYLTDEFDRSEPWFYFFPLVAGGFLPWTLILPWVVKDSWKKLDDKIVFLILWVALPFLFFSFSKSKLPQYVLPIYPALAMLSGQAVASLVNRSVSEKRQPVYLPWIFSAGFVAALLVGALWPPLLPRDIRETVSENLVWIGFSFGVMGLILGGYAWGWLQGYWRSPIAKFLCACAGTAIFFLLVGQFMVSVSGDRSAKAVARHAAPFLTHESQMAAYDTYLPGLIFYLRLDRPIWIVASPGKTTLMRSPYVSTHRPNPAPGHGKILLDFDEFWDAWKKNTPPLLVLAKAKTRLRLESQLTEGTKRLAGVDEYILVSKP